MKPKLSAQITKKVFDKVLKETTLKARKGSKKAAMNVMLYLAAKHAAILALGYRVTDENRLKKIS